MALPDSREKTFAPGSQIPSAVLNAIQDWIIKIFGGDHGDIPQIIATVDGQAYDSSNDPVAAFQDSTFGNRVTFKSPAVEVIYPLRLRPGNRLKSVALWLLAGTGSNNGAILSLIRQRFEAGQDPARTVLDSETIDAGTFAWRKETLTPGSPVEVGADDELYLHVLIESNVRTAAGGFVADHP